MLIHIPYMEHMGYHMVNFPGKHLCCLCWANLLISTAAWKPSATKKPRVLHRCHSTIVLPVEIVIKCDMLRTKLGRKIEHNSLKIMRAPQKPGVSRSSSSCSLHSNVQMFMSVYRISRQAHSCNLIQALTYCKHNRTTLVQPGSPTCNNMQHAMTTNLR